MFDHDEADYEIVPCMVLCLVFVNQLSHSSLGEVILDQLMIGLAIILVPHQVIGHCLVRVAVTLLMIHHRLCSPQVELGELAYLLAFFS